MRYYIGVDIGGMSIKVGVVEQSGKLAIKNTFETRIDQTAESVVRQLGDFILEQINLAGLSISEIAGIGVGIPGTVHENIVRYSNNLHWSMVPIVDILASQTGFPKEKIFAENDANVAILGEKYCGVCKDVEHCVMITLGTGVGTGIVSHGTLITGNGSCGAEGGHTVIDPKGARCTCGRRGCFETFASATALMRMTNDAITKNPDSDLATLAKEKGVTGKTVFDAYKTGDKTARRIVKKYFSYITLGIVNIANLLRPEMVVLGGGVANEGEWFIKTIQKQVDKDVYGGSTVNPPVVIKKASLGNDAGIIGAASLVMYSLK